MNPVKIFRDLGLYMLTVCMCLPVLIGQQFDRLSFPVEHSGVAYTFPFAGGQDAPQVQSIHLDEDGLTDLMIFDRVGNTITPMIRLDTPGQPAFRIGWEYRDQFPALQQWMLIRDFNGDDVPDIFASTNEPGIQGIDVYRGRREDGQLSFEKMLFDQGQYDLIYIFISNGYTPMYAGWIDIPAIEDVDQDGDLDILVFEPGGQYVHYFKNTALEQGLGPDTLDFEWADICWGKFLESEFSEAISLSDDPNKCSNGQVPPGVQVRHSGSTLAAMDRDGDGDLELYLGDLSSNNIVELINGGSAEKAFMVDQDTHFPSDNVPVDLFVFPAPNFVDINGDGLRDFIATANNAGFSENYNVIWYYENTGSTFAPDYNLRQTDLFVDQMLDFGSSARPCFVDINADGLTDILVGTEGFYDEGARAPALIYLRNTGSADAPSFVVEDTDYLGFSVFASLPTWGFAPAAGDLDGDGDTDLVIGEQNGQLFYLENTAGPQQPATFANPVYPFMDLNVGVASTPAIVDINGDGLMDLVVGERTGNNSSEGRCGNMNYFQNQGSELDPVFDSDVTAFPNTNCFGSVLFNSQAALREYSSPVFFNGITGLELLTGSEQGKIRHYAGIREHVYDAFDLVGTGIGGIADGFRSAPAMADLDADGNYEILVGNLRGGLTLYKTDFPTQPSSAYAPANNSGIGVYPNPATAHIQIKLPEHVEGRANIRIIDLQGRVVGAHKWIGNSGSIPTVDLPPGVYIVVVRTETGNFRSRFVKG